MRQLALMSLLDEAGGENGMSMAAFYEIVERQIAREVPECVAMGEQLVVRGMRTGDRTAYFVIAGQSSGDVYGELELESDEAMVAPIEYVLQMALNGSGDREQAEAICRELEKPLEQPEDPDLMDKWRSDEAQRQHQLALISRALGAEIAENEWQQVFDAIPLHQSVHAHFMGALRELRQLPVEAQRIGHHIKVEGRADALPAEVQEHDGERVRLHGIGTWIVASVPDVGRNFGAAAYAVRSPERVSEEQIQTAQRTAEIFAASLSAVLNDEPTQVEDVVFHCSRCGAENREVLAMLDHEIACED
jgi:hypothetical protein